MKQLVEALAATAEIMGQAISPTACAMMAKDLASHPLEIVLEALAEVRRTHTGRLTLAVIEKAVEKLRPDGRPGADEAWAMLPRDEYATSVMTQEMAQAMAVAKPLMDEGDLTAARLAFREAYTRIVAESKRAGMPAQWFASLGFDPAGRAPALAEAARLNRTSAGHALSLMPPADAEQHRPMLCGPAEALKLEQRQENLRRIKEMARNILLPRPPMNDDEAA